MSALHHARATFAQRLRNGASQAAGLVLTTSLGACGPFLSQSGPSRQAVLMNATATATPAAASLPYRLVRVDAATLPALEMVPSGPSLDFPAAALGPRGTIGVGDDIGITIFEASPGGLFITDHAENPTGNSVTLPSQQVDESGRIAIPYGGAVEVLGRTPSQVEHEMEQRLSGRALEPQVVVTILNRRSGMITVLGDTGSVAHFSLDPGGETLLGAIARAGGPRFPDYETIVTLHRHGAVERTRLSDIVAKPNQNVSLEPGDTIYLTHRPEFFLAIGATGQATSLGPIDRRISFGDVRITLADALAKAGGLEDDRANARACFVYRLEHITNGRSKTVSPTVYLTDLRDPAGYFYASQFPMQAEDVIFVSNAPATDLSKFLSLVLPAAYSSSGFNSGFK